MARIDPSDPRVADTQYRLEFEAASNGPQFLYAAPMDGPTTKCRHCGGQVLPFKLVIRKRTGYDSCGIAYACLDCSAHSERAAELVKLDGEQALAHAVMAA